jgi:hypothetical protein
MKHIFIFLLTTFAFCSCSDDFGKQDLRIFVNGRVTDEQGRGISNAKITIHRGKAGNFVGTRYAKYDSTFTNSNGNYKYTIDDEGYSHQVCCFTPSGYTRVEDFCQKVNENIIDSRTIPNTINFKVIR